MVRWFLKICGQGLVVLIPIGLTLWLVLGLGYWLEQMLANPFKEVFPAGSQIYRVGMGLAAFTLLVFMVGLLMNLWVVRRLFGWIEKSFKQLPVVKTVFGAIQDVMRFIAGGKGGVAGDMVVLVDLPGGMQQLGIVTRQHFDDLPIPLGGEKRVAVYLPFSYQLGGFTYFIAPARCKPVPGMSIEDAMRYAMMAFLGSEDKKRTTKVAPRPKDG